MFLFFSFFSSGGCLRIEDLNGAEWSIVFHILLDEELEWSK